MEVVVIAEDKFSTADAEDVTVSYDGCDVVVGFKDWREIDVVIKYQEAIAFTWDRVMKLLPDEPYDGPCEIKNSRWINEHLNAGEMSKPEADACRHFVLNFNAEGKFSVLAMGYTIVQQDK